VPSDRTRGNGHKLKHRNSIDYPFYFFISVVLYYTNNEIWKANQKIGISKQINFWQKQGGYDDLSVRFPN